MAAICSGLLMLMLAGCHKQDIPLGTAIQHSVYFTTRTYTAGAYTSTVDSMQVSFVGTSDTVTRDTVWLPVRIAGPTASVDRPIDIAVVDSSTTAVKGQHYQLMNYVMPKDSFSTQLPVILYRTPDLKNTAVTLSIRIQPNKDFPVLMKDTLAGSGYTFIRTHYKIIFADMLIKPANWDSFLVYIFGSYSKVKYKFIIDVTGMVNFPTSGTGALPYGQLLYYQGLVKNALNAYVSANGPLIDESGNTVSFP